MLQPICSTISIAAVLGVLVIGCGTDASGAVTGGSVAPGSGAGGVNATGAAAAAGGGSVNIAPANNGQGPANNGQGGSSEPTSVNLCGNGQIDGEEECDKDVFATPDDSCSRYLDGTEGKLSCDDRCAVDISACLPVEKTDSATGDGYGDASST